MRYTLDKTIAVLVLIFKFSIKQLLTTPKFQPVPMPEDLIQAVNEVDTITKKIQLDHFDSD